MHTIRIRRSLFRFQLYMLPVTNSNCGAQMAWSEVASGSTWSSIEIEAQNCLFGCANRVTDAICIMHVFVRSSERQPRFIWGLEARSSDFLNSAPDAELKKFYVTQTQRSKQCGLRHIIASFKNRWRMACTTIAITMSFPACLETDL